MTTPEPKRISDETLRQWRGKLTSTVYVMGNRDFIAAIGEALARGKELAQINGALKVLLALWEHGDPKVFDAKFYDVIAKYAK